MEKCKILFRDLGTCTSALMALLSSAVLSSSTGLEGRGVEGLGAGAGDETWKDETAPDRKVETVRPQRSSSAAKPST
jgi:hypothetical protein